MAYPCHVSLQAGYCEKPYGRTRIGPRSGRCDSVDIWVCLDPVPVESCGCEIPLFSLSGSDSP
jgi:hypothetical protein